MHDFLEKDSFGFGLTDEKDTFVDEDVPSEDPTLREIEKCFECIKISLPNVDKNNA